MRFIQSAIEVELILVNVRIEQRTFIVNQVGARHNLFISPYYCLQMYEDAVQAIHDHLLTEESSNGAHLHGKNSFLSATLEVAM